MAKWKFFTLLMVGIALLWETRPAYSLAYLFLFLFFLLKSWQGKSALKLVVERSQGENRFFPQERAKVKITVTNPSYFSFPWVSLVDKNPRNLSLGSQREKWVFSLPRRSNHDFAVQIGPRARGVYRLGPLELAVGDLFGISTQRFIVSEYQTIIVYPQIRNLVELNLPSRLPVGHLQAMAKIYPDPTRLAGVRPYQEGDPLKNLHWPATARTQNLQVKQFEHTVNANCLIFLNLDQRDYEIASFFRQTELAISTAASLAAHLLRTGETCGLVTNGILTEQLGDEKLDLWQDHKVLNIPPRQGLLQLTHILTVLAGIGGQEAVGFHSLLQREGTNLPGGSILLVVVPEDTVELVEWAWGVVRQGQQVQIFVTGPVQHRELLQRAKNSNLQLFSIVERGDKL